MTLLFATFMKLMFNIYNKSLVEQLVHLPYTSPRQNSVNKFAGKAKKLCTSFELPTWIVSSKRSSTTGKTLLHIQPRRETFPRQWSPPRPESSSIPGGCFVIAALSALSRVEIKVYSQGKGIMQVASPHFLGDRLNRRNGPINGRTRNEAEIGQSNAE